MLRRMVRRWLFAVLLLPSCSRGGGSEPPPAVTVAPAAAPTSSALPVATSAEPEPEPKLGPPGPGVGTYVGAACTGRSYERVVTLGSEGTIEVVDRVSPCPPGAQCVWSGIVVRSGKYSVQGPTELGKPFRVVLSLAGAQDPKASVLPTHLLWWGSRGSLTEPDESCRYVRRP